LNPAKLRMSTVVTLFHAYATICSNSPYFYSMAALRMLFAKIHQRKGRFGQFFEPCRSTQDSCFELLFCSGRIQERFVKWHPPARYRHCRWSQQRCCVDQSRQLRHMPSLSILSSVTGPSSCPASGFRKRPLSK
jgi:hypothetical protein